MIGELLEHERVRRVEPEGDAIVGVRELLGRRQRRRPRHRGDEAIERLAISRKRLPTKEATRVEVLERGHQVGERVLGRVGRHRGWETPIPEEHQPGHDDEREREREHDDAKPGGHRAHATQSAIGLAARRACTNTASMMQCQL